MYLSLTDEDGALEAVHARVPAHLVVVVAAAHSVLAQHLHPLGQLVGVGRHHAGVARRAQVLGGIKAEGGGVAQRARFHSLPLRAPGLGGVFNQLQPMLLSKTGKGGPVGALAVEMHGQNGSDGRAARAIQNRFDGGGLQIEGGRVDVGQQQRRSGAQNGADRGEKAEWRGDDGIAGTDAGGGQRQPERVGARGAAQRMGHAQMLLRRRAQRRPPARPE